MKAKLHLQNVLGSILENKGWEWPEKAVLEPPRDKNFGDMSANLAMMLSKQAKMNPRAIAEEIKNKLDNDPYIEKVDIAGPGFLNFTFSNAFWQNLIPEVLEKGADFGRSEIGKGIKVQVEYVSANPTGPLHIGHGRGAALGDCLVRILEFNGHTVEAEYYVNDAGRQMLILGNSIWVRLQQSEGRDIVDPEDFYKGEYITDIAKEVLALNPTILEMDEADSIAICRKYGMNQILEGIKKDLAAFDVRHDVWFSEASLVSVGKVEETFADLKSRGMAYEKDGALWFKSTDLGDDKDRVLRKSNGDLTYFASDIAYHDDKYKRGFDKVVDIWGADHHGYVPRMQAAVEALGKKGHLEVILVQLVNLLRGGEQIAMSTRAGKFETLKDVVNEVGRDASRFMFLSRKSDSHLDFDLDLVKQKTMENPVYYVQYAHARICSVIRKAAEQGIEVGSCDPVLLSNLGNTEELGLMKLLDQFNDVVESAGEYMSPHTISYYLRDLANALHRFYSMHHILSAEKEIIAARLLLLQAVAKTLANGLNLLGVSAPEQM
ncbi:arginine--tRNA ligase [Maridesulfovibrio ferrireducens]|uniref:arginine--tRNA ligase n=1 Tax=Maridesulfovibrio ferrireducens TaxID=246191 RepID=UPI001A34349F|nr:arginine--tRNA ligase [Maridesulfovibrio ferrireducens]MBI9112983.1 arginine--tRNA ligase [Maridesulfovibrio ferrireducens]